MATAAIVGSSGLETTLLGRRKAALDRYIKREGGGSEIGQEAEVDITNKNRIPRLRVRNGTNMDPHDQDSPEGTKQGEDAPSEVTVRL